MRLYNSALEKYHKEIDCDYINKFTYNNSKCFTHDIFNGLPKEYLNCDVIYSEPFWLNGHKVLEKKGKVNVTFKELQLKINEICNNIEAPVVLLLGKNALKYYSGYTVLGEVMLHNYPSQVVSWRYNIKIPKKNSKNFLFNNFDLLDLITEKSKKVGDFMCGFGNTAISCLKNNCEFVCSDVDKKCVSVTKKRLDNLN